MWTAGPAVLTVLEALTKTGQVHLQPALQAAGCSAGAAPLSKLNRRQVGQ